MKHSNNAQFSLLEGTSVLRQDIPNVPVFLKVFNKSEALIKKKGKYLLMLFFVAECGPFVY